jgi:hypothetical protein
VHVTGQGPPTIVTEVTSHLITPPSVRGVESSPKQQILLLCTSGGYRPIQNPHTMRCAGAISTLLVAVRTFLIAKLKSWARINRSLNATAVHIKNCPFWAQNYKETTNNKTQLKLMLPKQFRNIYIYLYMFILQQSLSYTDIFFCSFLKLIVFVTYATAAFSKRNYVYSLP